MKSRSRTRPLTVTVLLLIVLMLYQCHASTKGEYGRIFLTFDDGPVNATLNVLTVLGANDVKATFFVNGIHLTGTGGEKEDRATEALRRIIEEGHTIGNHSFDHMQHNSPNGNPASSVGAYTDPEQDLLYFIPKNSTIITEALGILKHRPNNRILSLGRMPFSNIWRLPKLTVLCSCCTTDDVPSWHPDSQCGTRAQPVSHSATIAATVAETLFQKSNMLIYGWDIEWQPSNWEGDAISESLASAEELEKKLQTLYSRERRTEAQRPPQDSDESSTQKRGVIILAHDVFFENSWRGRGKDKNLPELNKLIKSLKSQGYRFDTLDHYLDD